MSSRPKPGAERHSLSPCLVDEAVSFVIRHYQLHSGHITLRSSNCKYVTSLHIDLSSIKRREFHQRRAKSTS